MGATPTQHDRPPTAARVDEPARPGAADAAPSLALWDPRRWRAYLGTPHRPRFLVELALIAISYWVYSLIRNAVPDHETRAVHRAQDLVSFEQTLHIDIEHWVNHAINGVTWLIVGMNYYYATLHFVITIGVLVWLYRWHPGRYGAVRTVLFATTALALVGFFFYALAPPRLLPGGGYIDTVLVHHTWGSMASGDMKDVSNQFAAMPSMHIGWSTWCAIAIVRFARPEWVKVLGLLYPVFTFTVILATGNHFVLDAVGGLITLTAGIAVQWAISGRLAYRYPRYPVGDPRAGVPAQTKRTVPAPPVPAGDDVGDATSVSVVDRRGTLAESPPAGATSGDSSAGESTGEPPPQAGDRSAPAREGHRNTPPNGDGAQEEAPAASSSPSASMP